MRIDLKTTFNQLLSVVRERSLDSTTAEGRSRERHRRIVFATGSSVLSKVVSISTTLISVPLTLNYLGTERYGLWMTISSVISMLGFADLGMGNGLLNAIAEANGKDDRKSASTYISSTFFMLLGIAVIIISVFIGVYGFIPWQRVFNVTSDLAIRESGVAIIVLITCFAINMPLGVIQRIQMGYQEDYKNQLCAIAGSLMGLVGILLVIHFQGGLPWLILTMSGGPMLATMMNWILLFISTKKWLFPNWKKINLSSCNTIFMKGIWFVIFQLIAILGLYSDNLIIAQSLGASEVASYAVTQRLFTTAMVSQFFLLPLWPAFTEAMSRGDYDWALKTINRVLVLSLTIGVFTGILLFLFAKRIISAWAGSSVIPPDIVIIGFIFWLILVSCSNVITAYMNSGHLLKLQIPFALTSAIASISMKIYLVHHFQTAGIIWSSVCAYALFYVIPGLILTYRSFSNV